MMQHWKWIARGTALVATALLAGCASMRQPPSAQIYDPNEQFNRKVLALNQAVLGPPARILHTIAPGPIRDRLISFDNNLKEPRILGNDLLQGRIDAAFKTAGRFVINSSIGIGGLADVATQAGIPQQTGDFGQTLFVWGVPDGPYMVLPFFGPSTTRDAVGLAVDTIADPVTWGLTAEFGDRAGFAVSGLDFVTQVGQLKQAEESSIDFYSFLRSSYYQTRRAQLREAIGLPPEVQSPVEASPAAVAAKPVRKPRRTPEPQQ